MSKNTGGKFVAEGPKEATHDEKMVVTDTVLEIQGDEKASNEKKHMKGCKIMSSCSFSASKSKKAAMAYRKLPTVPNSSTKLQHDNLECKAHVSLVSRQSFVNRSPSHDQRPPKTKTKTPTFTRSTISKPKSRFSEPPIPATTLGFSEPPIPATTLDPINENKSLLPPQVQGCNSSPDMASNNRVISDTSTKENVGTAAPSMPETQVEAASESEDEDEKEYVLKQDDENNEPDQEAPMLMQTWREKLKVLMQFEWVLLVGITAALISSLTINKLKHLKFKDFELWKWCVLLLVIFCGRRLTELFLKGLLLFTETNHLLRKNFLYFLHKLKKSVQVCIWLALVLITWLLLFHIRIKRSHSDDRIKISSCFTRALVATLVGAVIWMVKTLFMTILAASFHVSTFLDRIKESLYHQHVLKALSRPPGATEKAKEGKGQQETESVGKIRKLNHDEVSAWTMKYLFNQIRTHKFFTISKTNGLDDEEDDEQKNNENTITCEREAKDAACRIFINVVGSADCKYIVEDDLLKFFSKEEANDVFQLFEGAVEAGKIKKSMMKNWVVKVYLERKSLRHSLNDALKAVKQLNIVASVLVLVVILVVWLVLMELATTQVLIFISSQMFVYGNTAKTVFEGILFSFVTRPFDVGDRCVIDGVQMIVEEMSLLTTVFLRYDNEKIYYPNAVLATKSISNLYRSPHMRDIVEFTVDVSTTMESIRLLKERIKKYIESKPHHWNCKHGVTVWEIENVNKMKMSLCVTHTMNHQNMEERNNRRSDLVLELKKIFQELKISYQLLPQEVLVSYKSVQTQPQHQ